MDVDGTLPEFLFLKLNLLRVVENTALQERETVTAASRNTA
jgi:hypothetical protein